MIALERVVEGCTEVHLPQICLSTVGDLGAYNSYHFSSPLSQALPQKAPVKMCTHDLPSELNHFPISRAQAVELQTFSEVKLSVLRWEEPWRFLAFSLPNLFQMKRQRVQEYQCLPQD